MKKKVCPSELAYVFGIIFVALGVVLMEKGDFGVSMVVAPAYLIYRWLSPMFPFVTFGMAEYCLQAVLLIAMCIVMRRFRLSYLFSFITAVVYGFVLDGFMALGALFPAPTTIWLRLLWYIPGMLFCTAGVSMMFHTYISPEVYELFVKELSSHFHKDIHKFKTCYDIVSLLVGIALSFAIYGLWKFEGVKLGTIICAIINGWIISRFTKFFEKHWVFKDKLPWRKFFTDIPEQTEA